ncbi:hypothetical protein IGI04_024085 [Brassica rapa subsp. trilocularis]|uniref:Uncharacterized protein n=1 Tax=Brassica rapa subsp. trilocularis TaxID=1813537 RepID=A0ABQ7M6A8_BRACM|nr:hypothetical protein IGI04_024085 [Brassica rapa subsp. trilocularis]
MAATKMFLIKWYSTSTNLESSGSRLEVVWTSWKSSDKVVWTSRKSSGLLGSRLDFSERFGFSDLEDFWDDLLVSRLEVIWKSSGSRLDFLKVKSSGLLKSCLVLSTQVESKLVFLKVVWLVLHLTGLFQKFDFLDDLHFSRLTTYNSVVHETTEIRLKCKSSGEVKLLKLSIDDLTFSRLRLQISKSIAKITSALTRRLPGKSSTARRLKGKSSTARRLPNSLAYIRLLQAHRITNGSHPPIIVSFYDSMNHKNFRIKILGFFSSLWRESERYVVFSSQEWKKKKGKSILGALRASNWLFMVVVVLMTMAIL